MSWSFFWFESHLNEFDVFLIARDRKPSSHGLSKKMFVFSGLTILEVDVAFPMSLNPKATSPRPVISLSLFLSVCSLAPLLSPPFLFHFPSVLGLFSNRLWFSALIGQDWVMWQSPNPPQTTWIGWEVGMLAVQWKVRVLWGDGCLGIGWGTLHICVVIHPFDSSTSTYFLFTHTHLKKYPCCSCNEAIITCYKIALTPFPEGDSTETCVASAPRSRFLGDVQSSWSGLDGAPPGPAICGS